MMSSQKPPSMLALQLVGPPTMVENHLLSDENLSNLTLDDAIARINQLVAENAQLKTTIQQTNGSMKMAIQSFATLKAKSVKDEEENLSNYNRSKNVVQNLKKQNFDKDRIIEALKRQISEDPLTLEPSDKTKQLEYENKKLLMEIEELISKAANQENSSANEIRVLKMQLSTVFGNLEMTKQSFMQEKKMIQDECFNLDSRLQKVQSDEQQKSDSLRLQNEKSNAELVDVSRKYEQLMSDYHDLLTSNDHQKSNQNSQAVEMKIDFENRVDNLTAQLVTAEEVLLQKEEQIRTLVQKLNDLEPLQAQVAIYKADFEAERKSRENLNDRLLELSEKYKLLERSRNPNTPLVPVIRPPIATNLPNVHRVMPADIFPGHAINPIRVNPPVVPVASELDPEPDLKCPICFRICPDVDSLQLHVEECLERQ